jgi:hypothetical protein
LFRLDFEQAECEGAAGAARILIEDFYIDAASSFCGRLQRKAALKFVLGV